jgi:hypothetical protein
MVVLLFMLIAAAPFCIANGGAGKVEETIDIGNRLVNSDEPKGGMGEAITSQTGIRHQAVAGTKYVRTFLPVA